MCHGTRRTTHRKVVRQGHRFEIVKCRDCRFIYVQNILSDTFTPDQEAPESILVKPRHRHIKRLCDHHFADVRNAGGKPRVIEIGAGWGGLAQVFNEGADYSYTGFEPSRSRAGFCQSRGFDVRQELFRGGESAGHADAVVIDNVLEHVEEPAALFEAAVSALSPGGLLVVIVPNVRDVRQLHPRWRNRHHWQPHCHINYFSSRDLMRLYRRHGMRSRFFGPRGADWRMLPRVVMDQLGLHAFGLNCYGVKPAASVDTAGNKADG